MTHTVPSSADDRSTVTGRRRIAFAVHTDTAGLSALPTLLRSLALTNPGVCEDFVVLHPGLPDSSFDGLRRLHPRVVTRRADGRGDVFRLDGYDTVVAFTPAMVVLGDIGELLRLRHGVGAYGSWSATRRGGSGVRCSRTGCWSSSGRTRTGCPRTS